MLSFPSPSPPSLLVVPGRQWQKERAESGPGGPGGPTCPEWLFSLLTGLNGRRGPLSKVPKPTSALLFPDRCTQVDFIVGLDTVWGRMGQCGLTYGITQPLNIVVSPSRCPSASDPFPLQPPQTQTGHTRYQTHQTHQTPPNTTPHTTTNCATTALHTAHCTLPLSLHTALQTAHLHNCTLQQSTRSSPEDPSDHDNCTGNSYHRESSRRR